jgi:hypothetical protein
MAMAESQFCIFRLLILYQDSLHQQDGTWTEF